MHQKIIVTLLTNHASLFNRILFSFIGIYKLNAISIHTSQLHTIIIISYLVLFKGFKIHELEGVECKLNYFCNYSKL